MGEAVALKTDQIPSALEQLQLGDKSVVPELVPAIYDELRALAGFLFAGQVPGGTLQPTALVNEAYLKLVNARSQSWESRAHFLAVASKAMRQILTDYARQKKAQKRGGDAQRITLSGLPEPSRDQQIDLLALEESLERLSALDPQQAQVVELRFLAGLSVDETALVMDLSTRTVEREWFAAKVWLRRELRK